MKQKQNIAEAKQATSNVKHTPGPWALHSIYKNNKLFGWGIDGTRENETIHTGRIVDVPAIVPNHDAPTQEANARLIAAAPMLLEACKEVYNDPYTTCECAEKLKAAIAAAESNQ